MAHPELAEQYITSFMIYVPVFARAAEITRTGTRRQQVLEVMAILRMQYDAWFAKPGLPFALVLDPTAPTINPNPYVPNVTNIGLLDKYIPRVLPAEGQPKIQIHDMKFGHRLVHSGRA